MIKNIQTLVKYQLQKTEILIIALARHSSESWNPGAWLEYWIPAFAGMTDCVALVVLEFLFKKPLAESYKA